MEPRQHFNIVLFSCDLCGSYTILKSELFCRNHSLLYSALQRLCSKGYHRHQRKRTNTRVKIYLVLSHLQGSALGPTLVPFMAPCWENGQWKMELDFIIIMKVTVSGLWGSPFLPWNDLSSGGAAFKNHQHCIWVSGWITKMETWVSRLLFILSWWAEELTFHDKVWIYLYTTLKLIKIVRL